MSAITVREIFTKYFFKVDDKDLKKLEKTLDNVSKKAFKVMATGAAVISGLSVPAVLLEKNVADSMVLLGLQGEAYDKMLLKLTDKSRKLSKEVGFSARQIAGAGFFEIISKGVDPTSKAFDEIILKVGKFANVNKLDLGPTIKDVISITSAMKFPLEDIGMVTDRLQGAMAKAQLSMGEMNEAIGKAAPTANSLKIPFENLLTIIDVLANNNIRGAEAGNAFRRVMTRFTAPTKEAQQALKDLNTEIFSGGKLRPVLEIFEDLRKGAKKFTDEQKEGIFKRLVGDETITPFKILLATTKKEIDSLNDSIGDTDDAVQKSFIERMKAADKRIESLGISVENLGSAISQDFVRKLAPAVGMMADFVQKVAMAVQESETLRDVLTGLMFAILGATGMAAVVFVFSKWLLIMLALQKAVAIIAIPFIAFFGTIGVAGSVIVGIMMLFLLLLQDLYRFSIGAEGTIIGTFIDAIAEKWHGVKDAITGAIDAVEEFFRIGRQEDSLKSASRVGLNAPALTGAQALGFGGMGVGATPQSASLRFRDFQNNIQVTVAGGDIDDAAEQVGEMSKQGFKEQMRQAQDARTKF